MAKKRKKDKEEKQEYEFTPPEFDEKEFLTKELRDTKTVLLTIGYGAALGITAGVLANVSDSLIPVGLALVIGGLVSLRYLYPLLKVDTTQFQKKNWAGNVAWFFFTFLAVWVLTFNYPLADHADPSITEITVWVDNGTNLTAIDYKYVDSQGAYVWVPRWGEALGSIIQASASYELNITAKVADNGRLSTVMVSVNSAAFVDMSSEGDHRYGYSVTGDQLTSGYLRIVLTATDEVGNEKVENLSDIPVTL